MDKTDDSIKELFTSYVLAHINYTESYEEQNDLFGKYHRIKERCEAKPYFYNNNREVKVKCYTDMFNACLAYNNKCKQMNELENIKDKYHYELKKRNHHYIL